MTSFLTPQKKKTDLKLSDQVRTPNFKLQAHLTLDISNFNKKDFTLVMDTKDNLLVPNISIDINSNTKNPYQHSGFLTIFNDVSGLGAWHRKWAQIHNYFILFWTYPEDINKVTITTNLNISLKLIN